MARAGTAARRYAEAVFELADRDDALDARWDDLRNAVSLVGDPTVERALVNPMAPLADREALVERLLKKRVSAGVLNLVLLLTRRSNTSMLSAIADEYQRLLNLRRGIVSALVTSALPLTKDEDTAIRARVAKMTGSTVEVSTAVDPALIGGLTVRIGDRLIDASVRGRLERLREQLLAGTRQAG